jgi:hypothetical protein
LPKYQANKDKNKMLEFELPSTPGARVYVPNRLGYGSRIRIRSASYKVHVEATEGGQEKAFQVFDPAAAEHELVVESLTDDRSHHNLTDGDNKLLRLSRYWIDHDMDEEDALWLGRELMDQLQDQLGIEDEAESAEGNAEEKKEKEPTMKEKVGSKRGQEAAA